MIMTLSRRYRIYFVLILIAFASCTTRPQAQSAHRTPITRPVIPTTTPSGETASPFSGDNTSTPSQMQAAAPNPAADSLIDKGVQALNSGNAESAEWNFEEAIHLAPNYGPAYYWMARIKFQNHDYRQAASLANKAGALTSQDPEWRDKIESLKGEIVGGSPD